MKHLKLLSALAIAALLLGVVASCKPAPTPTPKPAAPTPTPVPPTPTPVPITKITVATDATWPPAEMIDEETKEIIGFDIDLMNAIGEEAGFEVEFKNVAWDGLFVGLEVGEYDAICSSVTILPEREEKYDFSEPYFNAGQLVVVKIENTDIKSHEDLGGKTAGAQIATTGAWAIEKVEGATLKQYDTIDLAFMDLLEGRIDAAVADSPVSYGFVAKYPDKLKTVGKPFTDEWYGILVQKDNKELLDLINKGLAAVKGKGIIEALTDKWYGPPEVVEKPPLIIGTTDKVTVLDPAQSYDFHTWEIFYNVMETLITYEPGTTELKPALAETMEVSEDGLEYTFKLRPGMVFPDGTPLNSEAVKWSIDRSVRLEGDPNWLVTSFLDHMEIIDDLTFKIVLLEPVGFIPYVMVNPPWAPISPKCYSADKFDEDSTCSGHGPYKITKWERDVEMVLEANPDYYGTPPKWPTIIVKYFADSTTMRLAIEKGEIDVAWKTLLPTDYPDLEKNPDLKVIEGPGAYIRYICFNVTTPPFDDKRVRQAIAYAIDRDDVCEKVFVGTHAPLYSMVPMGMMSHVDVYPKRDLDKARALLTEAGFSEASPLEMDLWWTPTHYGPTEADVATVFKSNLEETGMIKVTLQSAEWATYIDNLGPGLMPVFLLGWYPDYLDPDNYQWTWAESDAADDIGVFYSSAKMDDLLQRARVSTDMEERVKLYEASQKLYAEDMPTIPFTQGSLFAVTKKEVTGVTLAPYMMFPYWLLSK